MPVRVLDHPPPPCHGRLIYGGEASQFLEYRRPAGDSPAPLAVMIHGGFWRVRYGLEHAGHLCAALSEAGYATANLEYRRVGESGGGWPGTFDDVIAGIACAREHAAEFGGDGGRTIVIGHSAGGHLALWAAAGIEDLTRAIGLAPVANLAMAYDLGLSNGAVAEFLGGSRHQVPERYAFADPARPSRAPRVIVHGDADEIVPVELSRRYEGEARLVEVPGAGHFDLIDPPLAWLSELTG